ncbi:hypothetical protein C9J85_06395 [Haloferax sp. wsp5]|nr:hypothetical protein C9J85_06395 [Haloferax sp. wsp5]
MDRSKATAGTSIEFVTLLDMNRKVGLGLRAKRSVFVPPRSDGLISVCEYCSGMSGDAPFDLSPRRVALI